MACNGRERGEFAIFIFDLVEHRMKFEDEFEQITSTRGEIKQGKVSLKLIWTKVDKENRSVSIATFRSVKSR